MGQGSPALAKSFHDKRRLRYPVLVDPEMKAYAAAGLKRSFWGVLRPATLVEGLRVSRETGLKSSYREGDIWQQGGAFVIHPGGRVTLEQRAGSSEQHVDPAELIAALKR